MFADEQIISDFPNRIQGENELISKIMKEQPDSIHFGHENKVYLMPDRISVSANGMFLHSPTSIISLPHIYSDQNGCYLTYSDITNQIRVTCGVCGYTFTITEIVTNCPRCGHPGN